MREKQRNSPRRKPADRNFHPSDVLARLPFNLRLVIAVFFRHLLVPVLCYKVDEGNTFNVFVRWLRSIFDYGLQRCLVKLNAVLKAKIVLQRQVKFGVDLRLSPRQLTIHPRLELLAHKVFARAVQSGTVRYDGPRQGVEQLRTAGSNDVGPDSSIQVAEEFLPGRFGRIGALVDDQAPGVLANTTSELCASASTHQPQQPQHHRHPARLPLPLRVLLGQLRVELSKAAPSTTQCSQATAAQSFKANMRSPSANYMRGIQLVSLPLYNARIRKAGTQPVGSKCQSLFVRYAYCVAGPLPSATTTTATAPPAPTQTGITANCNAYYAVQSGDSCAKIQTAYSIMFQQLYAWNPAVSNDCQSLWVGYGVCVGVYS